MLISAFIATIILLSNSICAEVITDGSLGTGTITAVEGPEFKIDADLGEINNNNLFHSFSRFNIAEDQSATFHGPANITHIITRITGGEVSRIEGALSTEIAGADLFLLNPSGVVFGPNARVDVNGSLHISSANYLVMQDLTKFMAKPLQSETLTTAAPIAFGFLDNNSAEAIRIQGAKLKRCINCSGDGTLTFAANGMEIDGASLQPSARASGFLQLLSINSGEVPIDPGDSSLDNGVINLQDAADTEPVLADIDISNSTILGRRVYLLGDNIAIKGAAIRGDNTMTAGAQQMPDTTIFLNAKDQLLVDATGIEIIDKNGGEQNSANIGLRNGKIELAATDIELLNHTQVAVVSGDNMVGESIALDAKSELTITDSVVSSRAASHNPQGHAADVILRAHRLSLSDNAKVDASSPANETRATDYNPGGPGSISIIASGDLHITGDSRVFAETADGGSEQDPISIELKASNVTLTDGKVSTSAFGLADAGNITVEVDNSLRLDQGSQILSSSKDKLINIKLPNDRGTADGNDSGSFLAEAKGDAGKINISAQSVVMAEASKVETNADKNAGDAGAVSLDITGDIHILQSDMTSASSGDGTAGSVWLQAHDIILDGAQILSNNTGNGAAGSVRLVAEGQVMLSNLSEINTATVNGDRLSNDERLKSAKIDIAAGDILLATGSKITAIARGAGDGGTINLRANLHSGDGSIRLLQDSKIVSSSENKGTGRAGNINLASHSLVLEDSQILTNADSKALVAGNITLAVTGSSSLDNADVLSSSKSDGSAGTIAWVTTGNIALNSTQIRSSNQSEGAAGKIFLYAVDDMTSLLQDGEDGFVDVETLLSVADRKDSLEGLAGIGLNGAGDIRLADKVRVSTEIDGPHSQNPALIHFIAGNLSLDSRSQVTADARDRGLAGDIYLHIADSVQLSDRSQLTTESRGGGGGNISLYTERLLYLNNSTITASVVRSDAMKNAGDGGDIFVDPVFIILRDSEITANNRSGGDGGNITLIADYIIRSTDSLVTASARLGVDGQITINALDFQVDAGENSIAADFLDVSDWIGQACPWRAGAGVSSFIIRQRPLRPSPAAARSVSPIDIDG